MTDHRSSKVLYFFPQVPLPSRTGAHKRCLELVAGLNALGCQVTLALANLYSEHATPWPTREQFAGLAALDCYELSRLDRRFIALLEDYYRRRRQRAPVNSAIHTPPGMRWWFWKLLQTTQPDLVIISYAYWDRLLPPRLLHRTRHCIDILDLLTLNIQMYEAVKSRLPQPPIDPGAVDAGLLQEDFFSRREIASFPEEFRVYDKYDCTIAISAREQAIVQQGTSHTQVALLPMTHEPVRRHNQYIGPALFAAGANPFNIQGYLYFARRVLPRILKSAPDFQLQVAGDCCASLAPAAGVQLSGFVADLGPIYQAARLAICPVFGGTGQQIKIVEAMANGLPVVALRAAAEGSPLRHNENALVAGSADEFADCVLQLWHDPALCRRLGEAARDTIAADYSRSRLMESLAAIVFPAAGQPARSGHS